MTSGRFWLRAAPIALSLLATAGCSGEGPAPCSGETCPPIEGTYDLRYMEAGIANTGDCDQLPPMVLPEGPLTVTRQVAELTGRLKGGLTLTGVVQDTGQFTLTATVLDRGDGGTGDTLVYGFSGSYMGPRTPTQGAADAGTVGGLDGGIPGDGQAQLTGNYDQSRTRTLSGGGSRRCQVFRKFTATRQP